jgi:single-strand DNA-binding protein
MYLNKAIIIGNLTRDPELKSIPSGIKVASFGVATNRTWKDQSGAKKEAVEYHNVVAFGKQAELIAQYCKKGNSIYVEGRMQTRSWDAQDGSKKYRSEIIIENFQFGPKGSGGGGDSSYNQSSAPAAKSPKKEDELESIEYPEEDINAEDIPF